LTYDSSVTVAELGAGVTHGLTYLEPFSAAAMTGLARLIGRMPDSTLADLTKGDAVMIVSTQGQVPGTVTAITVLAGVEPILTASPERTMTLSPWSLNGGGGSDTNLGVDILGGIFFGEMNGRPMFVDVKAGITDEVPDWKFQFGFNF
jgi:hypothetical protein